MASTINAKTTGVGGIDASGDASGVLALQTGGTTAVTIDSNGALGVGTTTPSTNSSSGAVVQSYRVNAFYAPPTNATVDDIVKITSKYNAVSGPSAAVGSGPAIVFSGGIGDNQTRDRARIAALYEGFNVSGLSFQTQLDADTIVERMRINSSGNVLVNNTAGTGYKLNIYGDAGTTLNVRRITATEGLLVNFQNPAGTQTGYIYNLASSTSYVTISDYRLKENVLPMVGALETIAQLKPVTYDWISDKSKGQGFIAHELQAVVPDCVTGEKDAVDAEGNPQYQGIDTSFLVATLTSAIQELKAIIDTQQTRITALEAK